LNRIAIEYLSVFGLPPVEFVHMAAMLGCSSISTGLTGLPLDSLGYAPFSLRDDASLRQDMRAAMDDYGVAISLGEGFYIVPRMDWDAIAVDLDLMCDLGAAQINTLGLDPDQQRTFDELAKLAGLVAERGMQTTLEMMPGTAVGHLEAATAALQHVGRSDFRLLIDTMHLVRSGAGALDIRSLDDDTIGYAQISDSVVIESLNDYIEAATFERMIPGTGILPLADIVAALPETVPLGIEVPMRSLAQAGVGPVDRLRPCVDAVIGLLSADASDPTGTDQ